MSCQAGPRPHLARPAVLGLLSLNLSRVQKVLWRWSGQACLTAPGMAEVRIERRRWRLRRPWRLQSRQVEKLYAEGEFVPVRRPPLPRPSERCGEVPQF